LVVFAQLTEHTDGHPDEKGATGQADGDFDVFRFEEFSHAGHDQKHEGEFDEPVAHCNEGAGMAGAGAGGDRSGGNGARCHNSGE